MIILMDLIPQIAPHKGNMLTAKNSSFLSPKSLGFTLIEILVVVLMAAILASLIIPRLLNQSGKAIAAEAISMAGSIKRAELRYFDEKSSWFETDDACADSEALLLTCGGNEKWTYAVAASGNESDADVSITAQLISEDSDKLILYISGANKNKWSGAGSYAPGAENWPNIPKTDEA